MPRMIEGRTFSLASALLVASGLALVGCQVGTRSPQRPPSAGPAYAPPPMGAHGPIRPAVDAQVAESFRPHRLGNQGAMPLFLPGSIRQQLVKYEVVDGMAVMEGDILLGPVEQLAFRYGIPWMAPTNVKSAVARTGRNHLWPNAEIPYVIDSSVGARAREHIAWAVAHMNTTELKLRPRTNADKDYVAFVNEARGGCSSYVGRIGGRQEIQLEDDCGRGSTVHEILHAAGFYHEQSRGDRDEFVTIHWDEIAAGRQLNFEKRDSLGQDIGPYDYGSIMHYSSRAFSRTGKPTITPKKANVTIGQRDGLSELDRAAISYLYGNGTSPEPKQPSPPPSPTPEPSRPPTQPAWNGSFAGEYSSAQGNVSCSQNGATVSCTFPGGSLFCNASGTRLDCGWTGAGAGRASFERQPSGVLEGTYGDFFSSTSRGSWTLTPVGSSPGQPAPPQPPPPQPPPPPPPSSSSVSLAGAYTSTRGPMTCSEVATSLRCSFTEQGAGGQLDCQKDASGSSLSCTWMTFFPRPGGGRAVFTRRSPTERNLTGTWGHFTAASGAGTWEMTGSN